jgi:hypothetical protein
MNDTFFHCTDELWRCLSEHDLVALRASYALRLAEARQTMDEPQGKGAHDTLVQTWRLLQDICDALAAEQARRTGSARSANGGMMRKTVAVSH